MHRFFLPVEPPTLDSVADKRLLVWCELYFHRFQGSKL
jgi:hypothetical protein